jgi:two-component system OmpR family sensor kinase
MSLRLRLTLLYTTLLGGVLLLFGGMVYGLVSIILYNKIDTTLSESADDLVALLRLNANEQFDARAILNYQPTENILIQVWGNDRKIQYARPAGTGSALDATGRAKGITAFNSVILGGQHLRVLTVPMSTMRGPAGTLQIGTTLTIVDVIQDSLATILTILTSVGMLLASIATWLITGRVLKPLATMTRIATQITKADDLSRRIPPETNRKDEVGNLIAAFNQTLERLDTLFASQQRFLGDVSHELRTPLTVIKGNVGLIRKIGVDEESLMSIEGEVDRLTRLVGDLLLLNQAESGIMPLDFVKVDLDSVLLEVFQQMKVIAGEKINLILDNFEPVEINGDRDKVKQVFLNLAGNALQYTPQGGEVHIAMNKSDGWVRVKISDNGPGIADKDIPHIFDRFYRGEKSRTRTSSSGFGLGLSIAQWIVVKHGGSIEVQSRPGGGTVFTVLLPEQKH